MPMGQAPVLEIDGKLYHQSRAIGRLIAKRNNFYSSDDVEAYEIDATVDTIEDLRTGKRFPIWSFIYRVNWRFCCLCFDLNELKEKTLDLNFTCNIFVLQ